MHRNECHIGNNIAVKLDDNANNNNDDYNPSQRW